MQDFFCLIESHCISGFECVTEQTDNAKAVDIAL